MMVGVAFGYSWLLRLRGRPIMVDVPGEFVTAALVMLSGFGIAIPITLLAIISARRGQVRVWIGGLGNRVPVIAALGFLGAAFTISAAVVWTPMITPPEADWWIPVMLVVELGYFCLAMPIAVLWARDALIRRITACWPGEPFPIESVESTRSEGADGLRPTSGRKESDR